MEARGHAKNPSPLTIYKAHPSKSPAINSRKTDTRITNTGNQRENAKQLKLSSSSQA